MRSCDVPNASTGARIRIWSRTGAANQQWRINADGNGLMTSYVIYL